MRPVRARIHNPGVVGLYRALRQSGGGSGGKGHVDHVAVLRLIHLSRSRIVLRFGAIVDVQGSTRLTHVKFASLYLLLADIEDFVGIFAFGTEFTPTRHKRLKTAVVAGGIETLLIGVINQADEFVRPFLKGDKLPRHIVTDDFSAFPAGFGGGHQGSGHQGFIGVDRLVGYRRLFRLSCGGRFRFLRFRGIAGKQKARQGK